MIVFIEAPLENGYTLTCNGLHVPTWDSQCQYLDLAIK